MCCVVGVYWVVLNCVVVWWFVVLWCVGVVCHAASFVVFVGG